MNASSTTTQLKRRPLTGIALALAGGLLISVDIPVLRLAGGDPWIVMLARGIGLAIMLGLVLRFGKGWTDTPRDPFSDREWVEIGVLYGITMILFTFAVFTTSTANLVFILAFNPMLAALLAWWLIGERPSLVSWAAIFLTMTGVAIIVGGSLTGGSLVGDLASLGAAAVLALSITRMRQSGKDMSLCGCLGGIITALFALPLAIFHFEVPAQPLWLVVNVFALAPLAAFTLSLAPRFIPAPQVAMFFLLETVLAPVWVWLVFAETPEGNTLVGGAVVLLAIIVHSSVQIFQDIKMKKCVRENSMETGKC